MLLCRRLLFKTQIHKALVIIPICSHTLPYRFDLIRSTFHGYEYFTRKATSLSADPSERQEATDLTNELLNHIKHDTRHSGRHQKRLNTTPSHTGAGASKSSENAVDLYLRVRHLDRSQLKLLSPSAFTHLARQVFRSRLHSTLDFVTEDVAEVFRDDSDKLGAVILTLLKYACRMDETQNRRKLIIFKHLPNEFNYNSIPHDTLIPITRIILRQPQSEIMQHIPFLETAIPTLLKYKSSNPESAAEASSIEDGTRVAKASEPPPNDLVWLTLCLVHFLTEIGDEGRALHIFRLLVDAGCIPQRAVEDAGIATESFRLVLLSALIKTCLYTGWWNGAAQLLSKTKLTDNKIASHVSGLTIEIFEALYTSGMRHDVYNYCDLILALSSSTAGAIIPDKYILLFYDLARNVRSGDLAEKVYLHLRSGIVRRTREYPHPRGTALTFLMESFIKESTNVHGARMLAQHVVESRERIALNVRAPLVKLCALKGFKTEARILWERFATNREKDAIVGNASTMLRMVSVFTRDDRRAKHIRSPRNNFYDQRRLVYFGESTGQNEDTIKPNATGSGEFEFSGDFPTANGGGVNSELSTDCDGADESLVLPAITPVSTERNNENTDMHIQLDDREEYMAFARHIVEEFKKSKLPLEKAPHHDLNSLARAYGMLDDIQGCLSTLKVILDRREIPDILDINVALAAMARHDPSRAYSIVLRMIRKGVEPNGVTFATIVHEAVALGERELADEIMRTAKDLGFGSLTERAAASLIRTNLTAVARKEPFTLPPGETSMGVLRRVYYLIMTHPRSMYIHTPSMGKIAIQASLRANQAAMAFDFWKMLLRDHTEWKHAVQLGLRRAIADKIRDHCLAGKLDEHRGRRMLDELGEEVRILEKPEEE